MCAFVFENDIFTATLVRLTSCMDLGKDHNPVHVSVSLFCFFFFAVVIAVVDGKLMNVTATIVA